jgi:hypothetical protein
MGVRKHPTKRETLSSEACIVLVKKTGGVSANDRQKLYYLVWSVGTASHIDEVLVYDDVVGDTRSLTLGLQLPDGRGSQSFSRNLFGNL